MMRKKSSAQKTIRDIRRATRRHYSAEEKIRIVLEGLRGEDTMAELCRRGGLNSNVYYRWSKEFMEAGKKRLAGDTAREATSDEVKQLRAESSGPERNTGRAADGKPVAEKKHARGWGGRYMRYSASEKAEIINLVENSSLSLRQTLARLDIHKSTFYNWLQRYQDGGVDGLEDRKPLIRYPLE